MRSTFLILVAALMPATNAATEFGIVLDAQRFDVESYRGADGPRW